MTGDEKIAVVSVSGVGMRSHAGVAGLMFGALAARDINIQLISTSEVKISCVVEKGSGERALEVIRETFNL